MVFLRHHDTVHLNVESYETPDRYLPTFPQTVLVVHIHALCLVTREHGNGAKFNLRRIVEALAINSTSNAVYVFVISLISGLSHYFCGQSTRIRLYWRPVNEA